MTPAYIEHLYYDGKHYDQRYRNIIQDIPMWVYEAKACRDPVLELACGTGRVTIPIARAGIPITGIDLSDSMLKEARSKAEVEGLAVEWVQGDIRDFALTKRYSLIICPASTICNLLELIDLEACLACVRNHLDEGGKFISHIQFINSLLTCSTRAWTGSPVIPSASFRTLNTPLLMERGL
jgi:2-polyprenyl-3-methyl-5-hydroxy-6-metoxy-1,4-benzoquinol methylase